jgi:hypothetical protein
MKHENKLKKLIGEKTITIINFERIIEFHEKIIIEAEEHICELNIETSSLFQELNGL